MTLTINGPDLPIEGIIFDRLPELKRIQQLLMFMISFVLSICFISFLTVIYSLSVNYRTNTYEPILIIGWMLFFASGLFVTQRYYPMGLLVFAWLGIVNILLTCILIVAVTVGIVIISSQSTKPKPGIPFTIIPIVACLTSVILDAVIVILSFKLSYLIIKHTRTTRRPLVNTLRSERDRLSWTARNSWLSIFIQIKTYYSNRRESTVLSSSVYRPAVLMHGITSTATAMNDVANWLRTAFPGIYVVSIEVGNGKKDQSFLLTMDQQVEIFCSKILLDDNLRQGFNLLGYSQGSIVSRGAIERCSLPVYNFITLSGIHQGTFGVPYLLLLPAPLRDLLTKYAYENPVQNALSVANYWRDPDQLDRYISDCHFLPDINNEREVRNGLYRANMLKLNAFVMTYSDADQIVMPRESGLFMGYAPNSLDVETWNNSRQFTEDLIGLGTLWEQGKLHTFTSHVRHQDVTHEPNREFFLEHILAFFNNTLMME